MGKLELLVNSLSWIRGFIINCQKTNHSGSLKADKIKHQSSFWIKEK